MKLASLLTVLCLSLSSVALAQPRSLAGFVEIQTVTPDVKTNLILDAGLFYKVTPEWGAKAFLLVKGPWAEAYVGPSWTPAPWVSLFAGAGVSQSKGELELRTAYGLSLSYEKLTFWGTVELNNGAYQGDYKSIWYDLNLCYQPLPWLVVGLKDKRPVGFGPQVWFKYDVAELWVSWAPISAEAATYDLDRFMLGLKFNL